MTERFFCGNLKLSPEKRMNIFFNASKACGFSHFQRVSAVPYFLRLGQVLCSKLRNANSPGMTCLTL